MTDRAFLNKVNKIKALEAEKAELDKKLEELKDILKEELTARGVQEAKAGDFTVRYKDIETERFDSKTFKSAYESLYKQFVKTATVKRFSIV